MDGRRPDSSAFQVSVVVPAFRATGFVHRAVDSALAQDVAVEVIVIDDACPDHTGDAVTARYGDRDDVTVLRLPVNAGPAAARNAGLAAARADWVAVLDADDEYDDGRLRRLLDQAATLDADVIADNVRLLDRSTGTLSPPRITSLGGPTVIDLHHLAAAARPGTGELDYGLLKPVYRRAFLDRTGLRYPTDTRHGEDFLLYLQLLHHGARFVVDPTPGYRWSTRSSGESRTTVDYLAQVEDTRRLQQQAWVRADATLVTLLDLRIEALTALHRTWLFTEAVRRRRLGTALGLCLRHPHVRRRALSSLRARLVPA